MKIYVFTYLTGESDWIYAKNKKEAITFYQGHTGGIDIKDYDITEVPKNKWKENKIFDVNEYTGNFDDDENFCNGYKIIQTFEDYAKENTETDIIATSEY